MEAPTLVVEGTREPAKPGHGALIAEAIAGARLLMVQDMGHMIAPEVVEPIATALITSPASPPPERVPRYSAVSVVMENECHESVPRRRHRAAHPEAG
ncbi:alpha/beta fold hydrolase [Streptomyces sparsogenes]|uniref:alpha/beta fold hydrolase n=1 Tax=Streptomyces sparsogenes TaxID=67365 RepID=UPI0033E1AD17